MTIDLTSFYSSLAIVILIIALGFLLGKIKWIHAETNKQLVNLLLMVFMPAALFNAFPSEYSDGSLQMFSLGLLGGVIVMVGMIVISKLVYSKRFYRGNLRYEAQFAFAFNNATFLGYPIIATAFGEQGVIPYCGFIIAFNLALFSYGIWLFKRKIDKHLLRQVVTNPNIIAVLLGMILFLLRIQLPSVITSSVGYVASATTPLSLICIGYMLSTANLKNTIKKWKLLIIAVIQLTLAPLSTYLLLWAFHFPPEVIVVCTIIQALPTATSLGLFAEKYGGDVSEASEMVVVSTLVSMVTLPLVVLFLSVVV